MISDCGKGKIRVGGGIGIVRDVGEAAAGGIEEAGAAAIDRLVGSEGSAATEGAAATGATAYPSEIEGYKVSQHFFDRMAGDLGHRVPSGVVAEVIRDGQTLSGDGPGLVQKFMPGAQRNGVTVLLNEDTHEIVSARVGGPTR